MQKQILQVIILLTLPLIPACKSAPGPATISGDLRQWHKVTLTLNGPTADETDISPNPFLDYRMTAVFMHSSGKPVYKVPGYFAADGNASETSAAEGNQWRVHFCPELTGTWNYKIVIDSGVNIAVEPDTVKGYGILQSEGSFEIIPSGREGRDFRSKGRLKYTGKPYLQFSGTGEYFVKAGADSPENLLACSDFDATYAYKTSGTERDNEASTSALKSYAPHLADWNEGDPYWQDGKGKGLIGAINYLSSTGCNSLSFLTYNAGGDGDDVWPYISRNDKFHFDCAKLDQWQIIFDHAQQSGMFLHFKLQETENDDTIHDNLKDITTSLDYGDCGIERKLYLRELIARFAYEPALNWNLGEENTQTTVQQVQMAKFIRDTDPYDNHIVIHTYPDQQDKVYLPLLGTGNDITGISVQNSWETIHQRVVYWLKESRNAGKIWVVANDEQGPHYTGVPPDPGYEGFDGTARPEKYSRPYTIDDIRKYTLWGTLMAGGSGVEYYFGYTLPQTDLSCQDWRSRAKSWEYCRIALEFFGSGGIPFHDMENTDVLAGNNHHDNSIYCFSKPGEIYLVYLPEGGTASLDLQEHTGTYSLEWFDPRNGGETIKGSISEIHGKGLQNLGLPPDLVNDDWLVVVRKKN